MWLLINAQSSFKLHQLTCPKGNAMNCRVFLGFFSLYRCFYAEEKKAAQAVLKRYSSHHPQPHNYM